MAVSQSQEYSAPNSPIFLEVPIDDVVPSPLNPRKHFEEGPLQELAESIKEHGILEPLVVKPFFLEIDQAAAAAGYRCISPGADGEGARNEAKGRIRRDLRAALSHGDGYRIEARLGMDWRLIGEAYRAIGLIDGLLADVGPAEGYPITTASLAVRSLPKYELIAGERRWRAARIAGLATVPVVVRDGTEFDAAATMKLMLVENLQREDLDPIEEASAYRQLASLGMKQREIAESVHRSQPAVANAMRLLDLPEGVRERITAGELSASHGIALASYKVNSHIQEALAELVVKEKWPTKKLEGYFDDSQSYYLPDSVKIHVSEIRDGCGWNWKLECRGNCPHDAFRASSREWIGWCLRPDCFEEKAREAKRLQGETAERKIEEARAKSSGPELVRTRDLGYDQIDYRTIYSDARLPDGCEAGCPKRIKALDGGNQVTEICSDIKCWKRLEVASSKAKNKAGRNRAKEMIGKIEQRIDGLQMFGAREMAVIAALALSEHDYHGKALDEACERQQGQGYLARVFRDDRRDAGGKPVTWNRFDVLSECSMLELAKIVLEVAVRRESQSLAEYPQGATTPIADWYLEAPNIDRSTPSKLSAAPTAEPAAEPEVCPIAGLPCDPPTCVQDCPKAEEATADE